MIYLDNNASTKLDPEVRAAVERALDLFGNPSSVHAEGRRARRAVEEARDAVAALVGARCDEIVFTSGGTEANAMAVFSGAGGGGRVARSAVEHPSVAAPCDLLAARGTQVLAVAPGPDGSLDAVRFFDAAGPDLRMVSIMSANNEYGTLFPVAEIARAARDRGALVHTDAVQAVGRVPVEVARLGVDYLTVSAHKLHGPRGVGALYARRGVPVEPLAPGGGQEKRRRAGTENTPGIVGFGVAARLAAARLAVDSLAVAVRRDRLEAGILAAVPAARVIGAGGPRLPNTSAVLFEGLSGEALQARLDLDGVAVSVGSACSSGTVGPSPALLALGLSPAQAKSVVRLSLSRFTTDEEIALAILIVPRAVEAARVRGAA